jgi:hypothetical protein
MAYVEAIGDVVRVKQAVLTGSGQLQEWGMHYACQLSGGGDSRAGLATAWDTAFQVNLKPQLAPESTYYGVQVSIVKAALVFIPYNLTINIPGTSALHTGPTQVRSLISLKTAMSGRNYRGRMFVMSTTQNNITVAGHPPAGWLTDVGTYATAVVANIVTAGTTWIPCIYHRTPTGPISRTFTPVTSAVVSNLWATQRRSGDFGRLNGPPW